MSVKQINTFINKNTEVTPLNWVLPNKKEFVEWVTKTFVKYRADGKEQKYTTKFTPFKFQKLVRDYMQNNSPYRGVLLFYQTGAGKTLTAVEIAENLKTERNIVVMLPASLRNNFITEGILKIGNPEYNADPNAYKEKYSFISYNANNTIAQIRKLGSLDNKVIIIDEVHNLISKIMSGIMGHSKQGLELYYFLMNAQNAKIVALSGTPLINDPFEAALLFNILRGYIEITYFRILKVPGIYGEEWRLGDLENELLLNPLIDYLEINKINKSIEFHIKVDSYSDRFRGVMEFIEETCKNKGVVVKFLKIDRMELFPIENEGETFRNFFVKEDLVKGDQLKNEEVFKRRILGLISYYTTKNGNYPTVKETNYYRVGMSTYQTQIYEILRAKERLSEKGSKKGKASKSVKSTFRVFSRQACNFVFPETINRPYPDPTFVVSILKNNNKNKKNNKGLNLQKMIALEEEANENGKISLEYKNRIDSAIQELVDNGELYFRPGTEGLNKLSPKMNLILENIEKSPGLVFVYSNFRTLEGIELFSKVLDFNGFVKYQGINDKSNAKLKKYAIYSGSEDEKAKKDLLKVFTSNENKHGSIIKILLATAAGAEGLDLKNIRQIHIMEPYWNQTRIEQVIGRGVRRNSHIALPEKERNIEIFRYFSVFSRNNTFLTKDKITTDEYIEELSLKKQNIINELKLILKECAFDCVLNAPDIKGDYKCFSFGKDASGISYYPSILKDIVASHTVQNKKTVKKTLTKAVYFNKNVYLYDAKKKVFYLYHDTPKTPQDVDTTKIHIVFIDQDTNDVYDKKSVDAGNPIKIGVVTDDNKIKKMKA
jgi:superfamily II DNA or RNA helicase